MQQIQPVENSHSEATKSLVESLPVKEDEKPHQSCYKTKHMCSWYDGIIMGFWGWLLLIQKLLFCISSTMRKNGHMNFNPDVLKQFKWLLKLKMINRS